LRPLLEEYLPVMDKPLTVLARAKHHLTG